LNWLRNAASHSMEGWKSARGASASSASAASSHAPFCFIPTLSQVCSERLRAGSAFSKKLRCVARGTPRHRNVAEHRRRHSACGEAPRGTPRAPGQAARDALRTAYVSGADTAGTRRGDEAARTPVVLPALLSPGRTAVARARVSGPVMIGADRARVVCSPLHCDRTITPPARAHNIAPIALGRCRRLPTPCVQEHPAMPRSDAHACSAVSARHRSSACHAVRAGLDRERVAAGSNRAVSVLLKPEQPRDHRIGACPASKERPNARKGDVWCGSFSTRNAVVFGPGSRTGRGHVSGESEGFYPSKFQSSPRASTRSASPCRARRPSARWPHERALVPWLAT
jgi:hypothetical protein